MDSYLDAKDKPMAVEKVKAVSLQRDKNGYYYFEIAVFEYVPDVSAYKGIVYLKGYVITDTGKVMGGNKVRIQ